MVRFELARGRRDRECHTARFAGGTVTLAPEATPDVTIRADLVDFVREHASEIRARPKEDFFRLVLLKRQMDAAELDATLRRTS